MLVKGGPGDVIVSALTSAEGDRIIGADGKYKPESQPRWT